MSAGTDNVKAGFNYSSKAFDSKGAYIRPASKFRNWVSADGTTSFKAEPGRYHLYVSLACPWAHRTMIVRHLKGLEEVISVTVVDWLLTDKTGGWFFSDTKPFCTLDTVNNCSTLKEVYNIVDEDYDGRVTVPVLWDKVQKTMVNNESSDIIRMLNTEFNAFCKTEEQRALDLYPENLRSQIDEVNDWVYPTVNNGVYRSGFARSQEAYEVAVGQLFQSLDRLEGILSKQRYLVGGQLTEADIRLFTTLVRFDWVYHGHFKCNKKRLIEYPNIWAYTRDLYQTDGISRTVDKEHIQKHYYISHTMINPFSIVAVGPDLDLNAPHHRETLD